MSARQNNLKWHVVYTMSKYERKVASCISEVGIECYLPLHKVVRQWSDRKKKLEVPLFPNYVFVRVDEIRRGQLPSIKELVSFVSIEKKPVVVPEKDISAIRQILGEGVEITQEDFFQEGMKVRIKAGQLAGLEGIVLKKNSNTRMIIQIEGMMKAFSFSLPSCQVEHCN